MPLGTIVPAAPKLVQPVKPGPMLRLAFALVISPPKPTDSHFAVFPPSKVKDGAPAPEGPADKKAG